LSLLLLAYILLFSAECVKDEEGEEKKAGLVIGKIKEKWDSPGRKKRERKRSS